MPTNPQVFSVQVWMLKDMEVDEAVFLSYMLEQEPNEEGWIRATTEEVEQTFSFTRRVQGRILKNLKDKGYIEVHQLGLPAKRHIKINRKLVKKKEILLG